MSGGHIELDRLLRLADEHADESREDGCRVFDRGGLAAFAADVIRIAEPERQNAERLEMIEAAWDERDAEKRQNAELQDRLDAAVAALKGVVRVADRATVEFDVARAAIAAWNTRAAQPEAEPRGYLSATDKFFDPSECDAAFRAVAAPVYTAPQPSQWQAIETAPKDGALIMLGHPGALEEDDSRCAVSLPGRWYDGDEDGPDCMGSDGGFADVDFQVFSFPRSFGAESYRRAGFQPTDWMPLPSAPDCGGKGGG